MKYELIIFDADETLFDFKKTEREALKNAMLEFGAKYDEDYHLNQYKIVNKNIWSELEKGLITQEKLKTERFKRFFTSVNLQIDETEFAKSYMKHLANGSYIYDDSIELLDSLSKKIRLIIITNGLTIVQNKRIKKSSISHYFEEIIISEDIGVSKPNPYIFEVSLDRINFKDKSKVLIVGDSLTSDIQGGINFGIDTCWFNPNSIVNTKNINPTYQIDDLLKLKELVK